jgi:peptide/nickel transport system substrate-binding protein
LFADVSLRRAVNYAIDRQALSRSSFGPVGGAPTDQYLTPSLPGFTNANIYPFVPDVARARRLAHGRHGTAILWATASFAGVGGLRNAEIIKADLKTIGITVKIKTVFHRLGPAGTKGAPFDILDTGWYLDYLDPADVLNPLLDGTTITPTNNVNWSYFNDPTYNRKLEAAAKLTGAPRYRAYAELDADLARTAAPIVAIDDPLHQDFYSARIGCQVYSPSVDNADLAALCVKRNNARH